MKAILMNGWLVAALIALLGGVPLRETVFAGNLIVTAEQQWERTQHRQQLIWERFDKPLLQARAQREVIMAWQKNARLQQAKQRSQFASKRGKQQVAAAVSR